MYQIPRINTPLPLALLFTSFNCLALDTYFVPYAPDKQDCVDLLEEWQKDRQEAYEALIKCTANSKQKPLGQLDWYASEKGISNYVGCDSQAASHRRILDNQLLDQKTSPLIKLDMNQFTRFAQLRLQVH